MPYKIKYKKLKWRKEMQLVQIMIYYVYHKGEGWSKSTKDKVIPHHTHTAGMYLAQQQEGFVQWMIICLLCNMVVVVVLLAIILYIVSSIRNITTRSIVVVYWHISHWNEDFIIKRLLINSILFFFLRI